MKRILIIIVLLTDPAMTVGAQTATPAPSKLQFDTLMLQMPSRNWTPVSSEEELHQAQRRLRWHKEFDAEDILSLWVSGRKETLLLNWYRQRNRENRLLICALFLCDRVQVLWDTPSDDTADFLRLPGIFSAAEAAVRSEELEFVKKHAISLAKAIIPVLDGHMPETALMGMKYTASLTDAEYGDLLKNGWDERPRTEK